MKVTVMPFAALFFALFASNACCQAAEEHAPSFRNQVQPILAAAGCSSGACHGATAKFFVSERPFQYPLGIGVSRHRPRGTAQHPQYEAS